MERFLAEVCTLEWHAANDRGVPFADRPPSSRPRIPSTLS